MRELLYSLGAGVAFGRPFRLPWSYLLHGANFGEIFLGSQKVLVSDPMITHSIHGTGIFTYIDPIKINQV